MCLSYLVNIVIALYFQSCGTNIVVALYYLSCGVKFVFALCTLLNTVVWGCLSLPYIVCHVSLRLLLLQLVIFVGGMIVNHVSLSNLRRCDDCNSCFSKTSSTVSNHCRNVGGMIVNHASLSNLRRCDDCNSCYL